MTLTEQMRTMFAVKRPALHETPKVLNDLTLRALQKNKLINKEYKTGLPFDINVTNGGYTLTRQGPPFSEEQGIRVFIIDNKSLDNLYTVADRANGLTPEIFYRFLKMYERKNGSLGRYLALNKGGTVNMDSERMKNGYTLIVKKVDHPTKEKFHIPDETRLRFTPGVGFESRITERVLPWFEGKTLDLTDATRDVHSLNIKEPHEQPGLREFLRTGGYKDDEITKTFEKHDQENEIFKPNHNTLIIKPLREGMGPVPAPPIDMKITRNGQGVLVARLDRKSGVDGISLDGQTYILAPDMESLEVPLPAGNNSSVTFWFNTDSDKNRRRALEIKLNKVNGHVIAEFVAGIAEMPVLPFNPSAGIIMTAQDEAHKLSMRRMIAVREEEERRRKIAQQEAEMGTNITLFDYGRSSQVNDQKVKLAYHEGDERKLRAMVEELTK